MKQYKRIRRSGSASFYALIFALVLVILSSYLTADFYARYRTGDTAADNSSVASFTVETNLQTQTASLVLENIKPGFEKTISLTVTNKSEVSISYEFQVDFTENLPLEFTFTNTRAGQLLIGMPQTATHTLTIKWPDDEKDVSLTSEIDILTISLICTQVD